MSRRSPLLLAVPATLVLVVAALVSMLVGAMDLSPGQVLGALLSSDTTTPQAQMIVQGIRLPRAVLACSVGAVLGISGAAMQGMFRNPLADPSLIGVTAGATAGASIAIVFGAKLGGSAAGAMAGTFGLGLISLGAFAGGALAVWLVYRLATDAQGTSVANMLLAGIAITALAGSLSALLEFSASNDMLRRISLWRMGGLDGADGERATIGLGLALLLLIALPRFAVALNVLALGESEARHLGIDVETMKTRLILLVAAGVGVAVALAGSIAFIGLVVPHMVRLLIGPDHRYLLPLSALLGASLLLLADAVARLVLAPVELPVGILTAALGAPFFISLLRHRREFGMP